MSCKYHSTYRTGCLACRRSRTGSNVPYVQNPHVGDTPSASFWSTDDSSACSSSEPSSGSSSDGGSSGGCE